MIKRRIGNLKNYPQDGNHLECYTSLPFNITKGQNGFYYMDSKGNEKTYNKYKSDEVIEKRWIAELKPNPNKELEKLFFIKCSTNLDLVIDYCTKIYIKSLELQLKNIREELNND